jgi:hypothetical protein
MQHNEFSVSYGQLIFIAHGRRNISNQLKKTFTPGRNVGAMLDVVGCSEVKCFCLIAFVKECFKSLQNSGLIPFFLWAHSASLQMLECAAEVSPIQ